MSKSKEIMNILSNEELHYLVNAEQLQNKLSWFLGQLSKPPLSNLEYESWLELLANPEQLRAYGCFRDFFSNPNLPTRQIAVIAISQHLLANRAEVVDSISSCLFKCLDIVPRTLEELSSFCTNEWRVLSAFLQSAKLKGIRVCDKNKASSRRLFQTIASSPVRELTVDVEIVESNLWEDFLASLDNKHLTHLTLENCKLDVVDGNGWKIFCSKIATSQLTSLSFKENNLGNLDATRWRELLLAIRDSKITSLSLSANQLHNLDPDCWQLLCSLIKDSKISSLDLSQNLLCRLSKASWEFIADLLQHSKIIHLDLSGTMGQAHTLAVALGGWQWLLSIILKSKITSLSLRENRLDLLPAAEWEAVCGFIRSSHLKELDLSYNLLGRRDGAEWQPFLEAITNHPTLSSLDLSACSLASLNNSNWQILCDMIAVSKFSYLGLECNDFGDVVAMNWRKLFEAFAKSSACYINLEDGILRPIHWQVVRDIMPANYHFVVTFEDQEGSRGLEDIFLRNLRILQARLLANKALDRKPEMTSEMYISRLDTALAELSNILSYISNSTCLSADKLRAQIKNHTDELLWFKAYTLNGQISSGAGPCDYKITEAKLEQKLECLSEISTECKYYEAARTEIFEEVFRHGSSERSPLENFIEALRSLFVPHLNPLCLKSRINQRLFDGYLFIAVGGKGNFLGQDLTADQRSTALQYVLLVDLKQSLQQRSGNNTMRFSFYSGFRKHRLLEILNTELPSIDFVDLCKPENIDLIQKVWRKAVCRLETIPMDDTKRVWFNTLNKLLFPGREFHYQFETMTPCAVM